MGKVARYRKVGVCKGVSLLGCRVEVGGRVAAAARESVC